MIIDDIMKSGGKEDLTKDVTHFSINNTGYVRYTKGYTLQGDLPYQHY